MNQQRQSQLINFLNLDAKSVRIGKEAYEQGMRNTTTTKTTEVRSKDFDKMVKKLNKCFNFYNGHHSPVLMKVNGGAPAANCHQNSRLAETFLNGDFEKEGVWKKVNGYNFTTCECGKMVSAEVHSVVKNTMLDEYYDFTTDFGGETHKWFLECDYLTKYYLFNRDMFPSNYRVLDFIINLNQGKTHKCGRGISFDISECHTSSYDIEDILDEIDYKNYQIPSHFTTRMMVSKEQVDFYNEINTKPLDMSKCRIDIDDGKGYSDHARANTTTTEYHSRNNQSVDEDLMKWIVEQNPNAVVLSYDGNTLQEISSGVKDMGKCECGNEVVFENLCDDCFREKECVGCGKHEIWDCAENNDMCKTCELKKIDEGYEKECEEMRENGYERDEFGEWEEEVPPSPPIREDSFKFNTKCVCSSNDYPCMCDIHEDELDKLKNEYDRHIRIERGEDVSDSDDDWKEKLTKEEKERWSHYDDICGEVGCKDIVGRHCLNVGTIGFPICFSCDANGEEDINHPLYKDKTNYHEYTREECEYHAIDYDELHAEDCVCGNNHEKGLVDGVMKCEDCDIDGKNYDEWDDADPR